MEGRVCLKGERKKWKKTENEGGEMDKQGRTQPIGYPIPKTSLENVHARNTVQTEQVVPMYLGV